MDILALFKKKNPVLYEKIRLKYVTDSAFRTFIEEDLSQEVVDYLCKMDPARAFRKIEHGKIDADLKVEMIQIKRLKKFHLEMIDSLGKNENPKS